MGAVLISAANLEETLLPDYNCNIKSYLEFVNNAK
jgi:hypothetical protein